MYAKPSFPQQESSRKSKAGTPNSQQLPSKTQDEEPMSAEETEIYLKIQDKIDQEMLEMHQPKPQPTESPEKEPSATSEGTTPGN